MSMITPPTTGGGHPEPEVRRGVGRPSMPTERIVAAALQLVDDGGAQALSMRTLAQRLACSTATLYRHFSNQSALIVAVIDLVMAEIDLDPQDLVAATWRPTCRRLALATFDALSRHRNVASLLAEHPPIGPHAMALREHWIAVLLYNGFPPPLAAHTAVLLARYVLGMATQLVAPNATTAQLGAAFRAADPAKFPVTATHHAPVPLEKTFDFGLELILDGISDLRDNDSGSTPRPPGPESSVATFPGSEPGP